MSRNDIFLVTMDSPEQVAGNIPLTETTFFILLSLADEARHGYAIMKDVETISEGRVSLSTGTLYGALRRLLEDGWIRRVGEPVASDKRGGRQRKIYALEDLGRRMLEQEISRMEEMLRHAKQRRAEIPS